MSQPRLQSVVHHLRDLVTAEERVADAELLARFADRRDDAAFTTLVQRHGPMVLGVCRRMLRLQADADDAWQATFLVLARKASAIRKQASIAAWLHGVALRVCQRSREKTQRHKCRELPADLLQPESDDLSWREVQRILDEEVERLPDRMRQPIVLCYLEGRTRDEAAEELGWTLSTFRGRLDMARERLRKRLIKRGLTLPAALLATLLTQAGETAAIPQLLLEAVLPAALSGSASASLTPLIEGGIKAMSTTKMPAMISVVLAAGLMIGGGAHFGQRQNGPEIPGTLAAAENPVAEPSKDKPEPSADALKDVEANADRLQVTFELLPVDPKGAVNPPYPLRYVMLNVLPIPIEPHATWPNGKPIGADARITKEQAGKIVAALIKLEFFQRAASDLPAIATTGPHAKLHIRYRPEGATETKHYWRPLGWDLKMSRHLQVLRACVDGDAAKHLDAMLESLAPERKKWEADGALLDEMQGRWRLKNIWLPSDQSNPGWPLPPGKLTITGERIDISIGEEARLLARKFSGKVVLRAPPVGSGWWADRDRAFFLSGQWSPQGSVGHVQSSHVLYHPEKQLLRVNVPDKFGEYFVFERDEQWGDAVEGLQIRVRPWKTKLKLGEQPAFDIDLRNRGSKEWSVTGIAPDVDVELDGKIFSFNGIVDFKATKRGLKPEEQICSWIKVSPDKNWGFDWKPGKHKVRLAYSIQSKVRLFSQMLEIEIVDTKEVGWGEALEGLQLRGWAIPNGVFADGTPSFNIGIRNRGDKTWKIDVAADIRVEVDGVWHGPIVRSCTARPLPYPLKPGERNDPLISVVPNQIAWKPGKHTIRLDFAVAEKVQPITKAFEIEIADPKEVGWGQAVDGLQLRGRATKPHWNVGEKVKFELDVRNRGAKTRTMRAQAAFADIEIDGAWHQHIDPAFGLDPAPGRVLDPNGQFDHWLTVAPSDAWQRPDASNQQAVPLKWTPGKHKVRLRFPLQLGVKPITDIIEVEIVKGKP